MEEVDWNDKQSATAAVSRGGHSLRYASASLKADREVVLAAVSNYGHALQHASKPLRVDREVVLTAAAQDGRSLRHTSASMRASLGDELTEVQLGSPSLQDAKTERLCRILLKQQQQKGTGTRANAKHMAAVKWLQKETVAMKPLDFKLRHLRTKLLMGAGEIQAAFGEVDELLDAGGGAVEQDSGASEGHLDLKRGGADGGSAKEALEPSGESSAAEARAIRHRARARARARAQSRNLEEKESLAVILEKEGEVERAESLYAEVIAGRSGTMGATHPRTLSAKIMMANLLRSDQVARHAEARPLFEEVKAAYSAAVDELSDERGPEHEKTLAAKMRLALLMINSMVGLQGQADGDGDDDDAILAEAKMLFDDCATGYGASYATFGECELARQHIGMCEELLLRQQKGAAAERWVTELKLPWEQ